MILLELFLTFLKIGAVSFGGGYAMISFIREQALLYGWLTESELLSFIAISKVGLPFSSFTFLLVLASIILRETFLPSS